MNRDDYSQRQKAKDAEYQRQYKAWVDSLPPDERRKLEAQGLDAPDVAHHGNGSAKRDAADSPLMREGDDPAVMPEPEPEHEPTFCDSESMHDAIRRVVAEIICHSNARLTAECVALVSGFAYTGSSMTEIAKRHGVTRAAVSKRCVELTKRTYWRSRQPAPAWIFQPSKPTHTSRAMCQSNGATNGCPGNSTGS